MLKVRMAMMGMRMTMRMIIIVQLIKKDGTGEPQPADALEVLHISSGDYHISYKIGTQIQNHKYKKTAPI